MRECPPRDTEGTCGVKTRDSVVKSSPKGMQDVLLPRVSCSSAGEASAQVSRRS